MNMDEKAKQQVREIVRAETRSLYSGKGWRRRMAHFCFSSLKMMLILQLLFWSMEGIMLNLLIETSMHSLGEIQAMFPVTREDHLTSSPT